MNQQDGKNLEKVNKKRRRRHKNKQSEKDINREQEVTVKQYQDSVYQKDQVSGTKNNKNQISRQADNNQSKQESVTAPEGIYSPNEDKSYNIEVEIETEKQDDAQFHDGDNAYPIDPGEVQINYFKLISGTSLDEDQGSEGVYISKKGQTDSTNDEEEEYEEENSSYDQDYEEEISSEHSDEYASVDSESFNGEHLTRNQGTDNLSSDDHVELLMETFCTDALVDIDVTSELDKLIENNHLSLRGRGRGRSNNKEGMQNTTGRGGRHTNQKRNGLKQIINEV